LILVCVLIAYLPALRGGFIWDDDAHVTRAALRSLHGLWRIWFDLGATQQYYPVLHSAFWLEHRLWGDSTMGYHIVNVILHGTAACLFALVLRRLFEPAFSCGAAWLAALLFALHPVCVESVAWVSEEKNTLSTVFYLLAAWVYLRWRGKGELSKDGGTPGKGRVAGWLLYGAATGLFVLALMSKSVTASLPAALLVVIWWRQGRIGWRRDVVPLLPWFVLGASSGLFTAWVERRYVGANGSEFDLSLGERALLACRVVWFYLGKLAWPTDLIFIYPRWRVGAGASWIVGAAALVSLFFALWLVRTKTRGPLAALLFFVGSLFPALGFLNVYPFLFSYVADHWQYLASLGIFTIAASGLWAALQAIPARLRPAGWTALAMLVCGLGVLTWRQCSVYRDHETVWRKTLERNPDSWLAHNNLGHLIQTSGRDDGVEGHYLEALRLRPNYSDAQNNYGAWLYEHGRLTEATEFIQKALRLVPKYPEAHNNLGLILTAENRLPEAIEQYKEALRLRPGYVPAASNLGLTLIKAGRIGESVAVLEATVRTGPESPDASNNLGAAYAAAGRITDAIAQYKAVLRLHPAYSKSRNNLGLALLRTGHPEEAIVQFREFLRYSPGDPEVLRNMGDALYTAGRPSEAVAPYEESIRRSPNQAVSHNNYGLTLQTLNRWEEAAAQYEEALRLNSGYAGAHYNLGNALNKLHRPSEAIGQYELALRLDPGFFDAENNLGGLLYLQGRPADAIAHFEAAVRIKPESVDALNNLGLALHATGRDREAEEKFAKAKSLKAAAAAGH
jgi:tetratricopeptide (TPR) repeat protein